MKQTYWRAAAGLLLLSLSFSGCHVKDEMGAAQESIQSAEDDAIAEAEFASVFDFVESEGPEDMDAGGRGPNVMPLAACAQRSWNQTTKTLTLDFGPTNCLCADGLNRRGKVTAVYSGPRRMSGSSVTVTLQDYYVNDRQHTGTKVITNLATSLTQRKFQVRVTNASIITPEGTISWNSNRTVERTAGEATAQIMDDVYLVTGSSEGVNRKGIRFTSVITQPLRRIFQVGCLKNFVAGILKVTNERGATLEVNYDPIGGEPCDRIAQITVNGKTRQIMLR